jgi:hypothetical protein
VENVKISLTTTKAQSLGGYTSTTNLLSDPLTVTLPDLSVCNADGCVISVTIPTVTATSFVPVPVPQQISHTCTSIGSFEETCTNGLKVSFTCAHASETFVKLCPGIRVTPTCGRLLSSTATFAASRFGAMSCNTTAYDATQTTCACTVPKTEFISSSVASGRRLVAATGSGDSIQLATLSTQAIVFPSEPSSAPTDAGTSTGSPLASPTTLHPTPLPGSPTLTPTPSTSTVVVKATQTILGVTDSPQFQADFKSALLAVLPTGSTVTDLTVAAAPLRRQRRLLAGVVVS